MKEANKNQPCQIFPVTDDTLMEVNTTPIPVKKPVPPLASTVSAKEGDTYQKPPPPNVVYQPIMPFYVLPPNHVSVYGKGADNHRFPHSPFGGAGFFPAPQWFLDLQKDKVDLIPQHSSNPKGNQRGSLPVKRFDLTSSKTSSEEDSDGD